MTAPRTVVVAGLPGAGKTGLARELVRLGGLNCLPIDAISTELRRSAPELVTVADTPSYTALCTDG